MADYSELIEHVLAEKPNVDAKQAELVQEGIDYLRQVARGAPPHGPIAAAFNPEIIATDALGVAKSFIAAADALERVDKSMPGQTWHLKWRQHKVQYDGLLSDTLRLASQGANYIRAFETEVVNHFSHGNVDWKKDKDLISVFIQKQLGNHLSKQSQIVSQEFTNLGRRIGGFRTLFNTFKEQQGDSYEKNLKALHEEMKELQAEIERHQSAAAKIQRALRTISGLGFFFGWLISKILGSLGIKSVNEARKILDKLYGDEQELRRKKNDVARKAEQLAHQGSTLAIVQNTLTAIVYHVTDISARLGRFAELWAGAHHDFVELDGLLKNATDSVSQRGFVKRLGLVKEATTILGSDLDEYVLILTAQGVAGMVNPGRYLVSSQFGGSDSKVGALFDDSSLDRGGSAKLQITGINIKCGWVVDAISVTYRVTPESGGSGPSHNSYQVEHGRATNPNHKISLQPYEYISAVNGLSGFAINGEPWMGDCVQRLSFEITNAWTSEKRTVGPFGQARGLTPETGRTISWTGQLYAFAGRALLADQVGLRGLAFVELKG